MNILSLKLGSLCLFLTLTPSVGFTSSSGQQFEDSPFGFIQGEVVRGQRPSAEYLSDLGVSWNKIAPGGTPIFIETDDPDNINFQTDVNFSGMDTYLQTLVVDNGINITMPLMVFVKVNGEETKLDFDDYEELATVMIERYDGDGVDDAPGSPLIKYWFLGGSEMNNGVKQGVPVEERRWPLTEAQTVEYVKTGYDLIKEMHPEFRAILGGSAGIGSWQQGGNDDYYYNLIAELTGSNKCNELIFDYHQGSNPFQFKSQIEFMEIVDSTLNEFGYNSNQIWSTDCSGSWEEWQGFTEAEQAGDVVRRYAYTIGNGQEKMYWTRVEEYNWPGVSMFDYMGLVHNPVNDPVGEEKDWKKLSYYTYKLMVEKLEGSDWDNIQTIQESNNVYVYKFTKKDTGAPVYIAWWGYFDETGYTPGDTKPITLTGLTGAEAIVTDMVLDYNDGSQVTDYESAFTVTTYHLFNGSVTISLGEDPVLIETGNTHLIIDSGDYNGDGTSDIAIFRESSGLWAIRGITRLYFGTTSDIPVPGDYDGDGTNDIGIFRGGSSLWALRNITRAYFGASDDRPVPGDYDGDGGCDIGIFREDSGLWAVRGITRAYFGTTGDNPVPGDYSGDGTKDIAVFRGSSGLWALRNISRVYFGSSEDRAVSGDFDGSGACSPAIFRPASGLWAFSGLTRVYFGNSSDQAVPADYDGDSTDDIGIFRESACLWAIRGVSRVYFGGSSDIPVTR